MTLLSRLYSILDGSNFPDTEALCLSASELVAGGVTLLQYRNKTDDARQMLEQARELKRLLGSSVKLIMNDRADLCSGGRLRWSPRRTGRSVTRRGSER